MNRFILDLAKCIKVHVNGDDELYEEQNLIKLLPKNDNINKTEFTSSEKRVKFFRSSILHN